MIELGSTCVEHSIPLIRDAFKNLPLLLQDRDRFNQIMQENWHMQWKKFMLSFLISPWLNAKHQQFHLLPVDMQSVLQQVPHDDYWVFDTAMFLQHAPTSTQVHYLKETNELNGFLKTQVKRTPSLLQRSIQDAKTKRQRVVLVIHGASEIACVWLELPRSSRMVLMNTESGFLDEYLQAQSLTISPNSLQIWALNSTLNRLRELHMVFSVAFSLKVAEVMFEATCMFVPEAHPLRPLIEFVIFQLGSVYEKAELANYDQLLPQTELNSLLQQFEKRVVFNEMYWDVRQRVISRTSMGADFDPAQLYPLRTLKHSLYADPHLQSKHPHEHIHKLFDAFKDEQMQNGVFSTFFSERCEIEASLLQEFEKVNLSTMQNIQLRKWSDYVQKELNLKTNMNSGSSAWPYTVLCMLSDLIHLSAEHHQALSSMHPALWTGIETDDIFKGIQRIIAWVDAKQTRRLNLSLGSNTALVRDFITRYLIPNNKTDATNE